MPRKRLWHVAETPGHGCCFSVGIQDVEGNMVADVVYREDGPLVAAAPYMYAALIAAAVHVPATDPEARKAIIAALRKADGDAP